MREGRPSNGEQPGDRKDIPEPEPVTQPPEDQTSGSPGTPFPPTHPEARPGESIEDGEFLEALGDFEILGEIGRGGMGVVYKAFHPRLKREVALKVLIAGEDASDEAITRFQREAEAVAKLGHHPNIVPVYDIGREGRRHFFAMHFVEGKTLDRMIDEDAFPPRRAAEIGKKLAEALRHAHRHGVLHRDIKPANVLVTPEGEPQLTDFGLAKDVASESKMTRSGVTLGTPQYMPPEQAEGRLEEIDERSDIYAIGATLYELMTCRPPFDGTSVMQIVKQVLMTEPVSPRKWNPAVDRDLETITLKCLEKNPKKRYASAQALARDLDKYLAGKEILARPPTVVEKTLKIVRRNKGISAALIILFLVLVAGAVVGGIAIQKMSKSEEELKTRSERAQQAEADRKAALEEVVDARTALKKSRIASSVLRSASVELREVLSTLGNAFHSPKSLEEKREEGDRVWGDVEAFERGLSKDAAAQATWLAAKGWLRRLAGYEEEAFHLFAESRSMDPDIPYGWLFESMIWLSRYFQGKWMPPVALGRDRVKFDRIPPESESMLKARKQFEAILASIMASPILGEDSSKDLKRVLDGLLAMRKGDLDAARKGLTRALAMPEFAWFEEEVLLARAKVSFSARDFPGGIKDVNRVLDRHPD
ncbi:MAG: serine/threonine-protein kinase, partial [Planctomycetota bacterium]